MNAPDGIEIQALRDRQALAARRFTNGLKKGRWWLVRSTQVRDACGRLEPRDTDYSVTRSEAAQMIAKRRSQGLPVYCDEGIYDTTRPHCYRWDAERGPRETSVTYFLMDEQRYDSYCAKAME